MDGSETTDDEVLVGEVAVGDVKLLVISVPIGEAPDELSAAEREVAKLVLEGLSNREIAARRGSSVKTVANQLARLYRKLDVTSRCELAARLDG